MRNFRWVAGLILLWIMPALTACTLNNKTYEETFDTPGTWAIGSDADKTGQVKNGIYELHAIADKGNVWSTPGESLGSGTYAVEATQTSGPVDNGYGMIFKIDVETNNFYLFKVSGDGYFWAGWCENNCTNVYDPLITNGWVESSAINKGLNNTNTLLVEVDGNNLTFAINGQEVGQITDARGTETGDIGILVETLGEGGVKVNFDNFKFIPPQSE